MIKDNDKISPNQMSVFIILTTVGVGILSLPRNVCEQAGSDAWIIIILGGLIIALDSLLIVKLGTRFPEYTIIEYSQIIVGKFIGTIINILIFIYFVIFCSLEIRIFSEVLNIYLLPSTPKEVIMFSLLIMSVYLNRNGIEAVVRFDKTIFPILIFISIIFLFAIPDMHLTNLLPVFTTPPMQILQGSLNSMFPFLGIEVLLLLIPFINPKQGLEKTFVRSILIVIVFYLYVIIISIARLGATENENYIWPLMTVAKSIDIPGFFIERIEGVVISFWVFIVFTTFISFHFASSIALSKIAKASEQKGFVIFPVPFIYLISLFPENIAEVFEYADIFSKYFGLTVAVFIPLLLFLVSLIRRKGGQNAV